VCREEGDVFKEYTEVKNFENLFSAIFRDLVLYVKRSCAGMAGARGWNKCTKVP
jgi:hypothetical protein